MNRTTQSNLLLAAGLLGTAALARRWLKSGYSFRDRAVLITGGSRGLGLVLARQLARQGARLAICARDPDELDRAARDLHTRYRADVTTLACNVTERSQVHQMIGELADRWRRIDVLINVAGVIQTGPMEVMTIEDYEEAMKTHFWGPLYTTLAVLPMMRQQREGRIVNIASIGGKISVPHLLPYSASKFALVGLSEGLRSELAKDNIRVTTINPGLMRTGSPRNATFKGQHRAEYAWFSISDSLPIASMSAERAARQIIEACRRGDAEATLSLPALAADRFHGLFPGLTQDLLGIVNRFLPAPGGIGTAKATGAQSQSTWSPSLATTLTERAAVRNNEV
jgi:short-subunit dehydrogenase